MKAKIGFIGLGLMGKPMALRLIKAGYDVTVWNRSVAKLKPLIKAGAQAAATPAALAAQCDVVIIMVTGPHDVGEVLFAKNGVVDGAYPGLTIIDMSTIGRQAAVGVADALQDYGVDYLDAPVTGSTPAAEAGTLVIMVGGDKKVFSRCEKILQVMGTPHYLGKQGMGALLKLAQNMIGAAEVCVLAEALQLCESYGLSAKDVAKVLPTTAVASPLIKLKLPAMAQKNYTTLFSLANMYKDLKLGQVEARRAGLKLRVGRAAETVLAVAAEKGWAAKDYSVVREVVRCHSEGVKRPKNLKK